MPNTVYISDVIDAPIEKVWEVMRDYNDMPSYHPGIKKSVIENNLPSDQVGCVRRLTLEDGLFAKSCCASMTGTMYSPTRSSRALCRFVAMYAGVRLHRITEGNRTFGEWWADFEVVGVDRNAMIAQIGNNVFAAGFKGVASKIASVRR